SWNAHIPRFTGRLPILSRGLRGKTFRLGMPTLDDYCCRRPIVATAALGVVDHPAKDLGLLFLRRGRSHTMQPAAGGQKPSRRGTWCNEKAANSGPLPCGTPEATLRRPSR